jgi:hypothetical protein
MHNAYTRGNPTRHATPIPIHTRRSPTISSAPSDHFRTDFVRILLLPDDEGQVGAVFRDNSFASLRLGLIRLVVAGFGQSVEGVSVLVIGWKVRNCSRNGICADGASVHSADKRSLIEISMRFRFVCREAGRQAGGLDGEYCENSPWTMAAVPANRVKNWAGFIVLCSGGDAVRMVELVMKDPWSSKRFHGRIYIPSEHM